MIDPDAPVTLAEAGTILNTILVSADLPEAFAEPLTVRKLVGLTVLASLGMIDRGCALAMAIDAANGVRADGRRVIVLSCALPAPVGRWCDPNDPPDPFLDSALRMPTICIPADQMAHDLAARVAGMRRGDAALN